jgi:hypothetical protein
LMPLNQISSLSWPPFHFLLNLIHVLVCDYEHLLLLMTRQLYKELFFNRLAIQHHLLTLNLSVFYLLKILIAFIFSPLNIKLINEEECEFLTREYRFVRLQLELRYTHQLQVFYYNFQKI